MVVRRWGCPPLWRQCWRLWKWCLIKSNVDFYCDYRKGKYLWWRWGCVQHKSSKLFQLTSGGESLDVQQCKSLFIYFHQTVSFESFWQTLGQTCLHFLFCTNHTETFLRVDDHENNTFYISWPGLEASPQPSCIPSSHTSPGGQSCSSPWPGWSQGASPLPDP